MRGLSPLSVCVVRPREPCPRALDDVRPGGETRAESGDRAYRVGLSRRSRGEWGLGTDAIVETRARGARGAAAGRLSASEDKKLAVSVIQCGRFYPVPYGVTGHTSHETHRSSDLGRAARAEGAGRRGRAWFNLQTHRSGSRLNLDGRRG